MDSLTLAFQKICTQLHHQSDARIVLDVSIRLEARILEHSVMLQSDQHRYVDVENLCVAIKDQVTDDCTGAVVRRACVTSPVEIRGNVIVAHLG